MPLGDHLRPHQDVEIALPEPMQNRLEVPLPAYGIAVKSRNPGRWEHPVQLILHLLRSRAQKIQMLAPALRASIRHLLRIGAIVAQQTPVSAVIRQRHRTVDTFYTLPTTPARHKAGKAPPVQQQHGLLPALQPSCNCFQHPA